MKAQEVMEMAFQKQALRCAQIAALPVDRRGDTSQEGDWRVEFYTLAEISRLLLSVLDNKVYMRRSSIDTAFLIYTKYDLYLITLYQDRVRLWRLIKLDSSLFFFTAEHMEQIALSTAQSLGYTPVEP
jgi:hypothetical protein